jgi:hypothetical protein
MAFVSARVFLDFLIGLSLTKKGGKLKNRTTMPWPENLNVIPSSEKIFLRFFEIRHAIGSDKRSFACLGIISL